MAKQKQSSPIRATNLKSDSRNMSSSLRVRSRLQVQDLINVPLAVFGIIFLYNAVRRRPIHTISNVAAGVMSLIFVLALVFVSTFDSQDLYLKLAVVLFNPLLGPFFSMVAIVGTISLLTMRPTKAN